MATDGSTALFLTRNGIGHGTASLQRALLVQYLELLLGQDGPLPGTVAFATEGVFLVTEGSPALDLLRTLERRGVRLIVCKTSLEHYELTDDVRVGHVGDLADILAVQNQAAKVISL
jgi:intracellular sulfur oxidation DsrE/DsrF family protein